MQKKVAITILLLFFGATLSTIYSQNQDSVKTMIGKNLEELKKLLQEGKAALESSNNSSSSSNLDNSIGQVQEVVLAASERAKRLCDWDLKKVKEKAEQEFDITIAAIEEYLALVADNGQVHQAALRIRSAAIDQARIFRETATKKGEDSYNTLAKAMDDKAAEVTRIWETITKERFTAVEGLKKLKSAKELFIAKKVALGIEAAVKELSLVAEDLKKLSSSMDNLQRAITSTD